MAPRVLIFGTGAIGIGYACVLSRAIPSTDLVTTCRSNYDAARRNGFCMNSTIFGDGITCRPQVVRTADEAAALSTKPFDYIIVTAKAIPSTPSIAELLRPVVAPKTAIVLIQNGIAIEQPYADLYPSNPLLSLVVYFAATQTSPGVIRHSEIQLLHVGTYPAAAIEHKHVGESFVKLITDCGATAKLHDDVQPRRWAKLMMNATLNPICALSRSRDMQILTLSKEAPQLFRDTMKEVSNVAKACGFDNLTEEIIDAEMIRVSNRQLPGVEPSMLADALAERQMEVDAILGNLVKLAKDKDVDTPVLRTLLVMLRALNDSFTRA